MSSILSLYLGIPIYGHIVVINPYDRRSQTRTIDSSIYGARAFNRSGQIMGFDQDVGLPFMPIYGDP